MGAQSLVAFLAPGTYAIKGSHLTSLMCDVLMLLVMRYNRTEKSDFCKKPKVGCDVTDVTCDKVTEKSGFWRRRLLFCTIRPGT